VEAWAGKFPEYGIRIYATFAGLRYLILNTIFKPKSEHASEIMQALKSDPLFLTLYKAQECFRARLTPETLALRPAAAPRVIAFPIGYTEQRETEFRLWEKQYEADASDYAACSLVKQIGPWIIHPNVETILEFHDRVTRAESNLPLA
jgi:hypothetical protein